MQNSFHNFKKSKVELDFGTPTEAELQLKSLLNKQLDTKLTLFNQLRQYKEFSKAGNFSAIPESFHGIHSLPELKLAETEHAKFIELKQAGLTEDEIVLYLQIQKTTTPKIPNFGLEPRILKEKLNVIQTKLKNFENERRGIDNVAATATGSKSLGRHEMDLERSLYVGCNKKNQLKNLVHLASDTETISNSNNRLNKDPFVCVGELAQKIQASIQNGRKKRKKEAKLATDQSRNNLRTNREPEVNEPEVNQKEVKTGNTDLSLLQVTVPINLEEINENTLSLDEIRQIPKFKAYHPGNPHNVLYLKNLHAKVDIRELVALFGRFDKSDMPVRYRLLTGKMKGQAFLTFSDSVTAESAMNLLNGYKLRNRPMVIEYGKQK